MAGRKRNEPKLLDELFSLLTTAPAWLGPVLALLVFAGFRWGLPWAFGLTSDPEKPVQTGELLSRISAQLSPLFALGVLAIWGVAEFKKWRDRCRLDQQTGPDTIASLSWGEFERLLSEAFRRQGFIVDHAGRPGADGGIDLRLDKAGAVTLVQCKHWKQRQVGVTIIRELMGVVASEGAQSGIVVTSGAFTNDARAFAATNPIRLIDGPELWNMIREVQKTPPPIVPQNSVPPAPTSTAAPPSTAPACPQCGSAMVIRTAKKGQKAGEQFYGCTRYPACRGTREAIA